MTTLFLLLLDFRSQILFGVLLDVNDYLSGFCDVFELSAYQKGSDLALNHVLSGVQDEVVGCCQQHLTAVLRL